MRRDVFPKVRAIPAACCLVIALVFLAAPAMAATTQVNVTKYCDNNYSAVEEAKTLTLAQLQGLSAVYSNGPVCMQGGIFNNTTDVWMYTSGSMACFGEQNGTYVRNITDNVSGMNPGDELRVVASDGYKTYFNYTNVYAPNSSQGEMILSWQNETHTVPDYADGIRLFFYTPSDLNFTNQDMKESMAPWYWRLTKDRYDSSNICPSAKGLSVKTVSDLKIYPPHRYDFNTTGDRTVYNHAYAGGVTGLPSSATDPSDPFTSTSPIADDDGSVYWTNTTDDGKYAAQRFVFNVTESAANIERLSVTWAGESSHDASVDQGATTYIWKSGTGYQPLTGDITSGISDYIVNNNVTVLVKQNASQSTIGVPPDETTYRSRLATDYVKLVVTHHNTNSKYTL